MNAERLRDVFTSFAGVERFRKFAFRIIRDLEDGRGLRYWQEQTWAEFAREYPGVPSSLQEIRGAFSWCYVHRSDIVNHDTPNWLEEGDRHPDLLDALEKQFPFSIGHHLCLKCVADRDNWIAEHPVTPKPQTAIAWQQLETCLFELTAAEIREFANSHDDEEFYGFMFDCNSEYGQILLCLNTEGDLQQQAESYKKLHPDLYGESTVDEIRSSLRWNAGDWKYQGFNSVDFDAAWKTFESLVSGIRIDEEKNEQTFLTPTQDRFMKSACRVLVRLEDQGAFECIRRTNDFTTYVADHDEAESDSWDRLARVRAEYDA